MSAIDLAVLEAFKKASIIRTGADFNGVIFTGDIDDVPWAAVKAFLKSYGIIWKKKHAAYVGNDANTLALVSALRKAAPDDFRFSN